MDDAPYADRAAAGEILAGKLAAFANRDDVTVLGLPRGGVPVAAQVARRLGAPLDVLVVRKLGAPNQPELAMGALAIVGQTVIAVQNEQVRQELARRGIDDAAIAAVIAAEQAELLRREGQYRAGRTAAPIAGRTVLIVDDGLATGASMRAAVQAVRGVNPAEVVVAVPVAAPEATRELAAVADSVICAWQPAGFLAVGQAYEDFAQTTDAEVTALLKGAAR